MAKEKTKKLVRYTLPLSTQTAWILDWLLEHTDAKDDSDAIRNAARLHLTLLLAYEDRTSLFSQKGSSKPFPIHLLAPAKLVELPIGANGREIRQLVVKMSRNSYALFKELKQLTKAQDLTATIENALCLHYDLLCRYLRTETFFIRDGKTSRFEQVEIFATSK